MTQSSKRSRPEPTTLDAEPEPVAPPATTAEPVDPLHVLVQPLFPEIPLEEIEQIHVYDRVIDPSLGGNQRTRHLSQQYFASTEPLHTIDEARIGDDRGAGTFDVAARNSHGHMLRWTTVHIGESYVAQRAREREAWTGRAGAGGIAPAGAVAPPRNGAPIVETAGGFVGVQGLDPQFQAFMLVMTSQLAAVRDDGKAVQAMMLEMHKATMTRPIDASGSEAALSEYRRMLKQYQDENERLREQNERERRSNTQLAVRHAEATAQAPSTLGAQLAQTAFQNAPQLMHALATLLGTLANANPNTLFPATPPGAGNGSGGGNNGNNGGAPN